MTSDLTERWDAAYALGDTTRSWFQTHPAASLAMLDALGVAPGDALVDIGGGASTLVDSLLAAGHSDLTVLDVSPAGLDTARARLGAAATQVTWLVTDVLQWQPRRRYAVWHDRAVFHFLTEAGARQRYRDTLDRAVDDDGAVVLGTFATDGPTHCSGMPVARYDVEGIRAELGEGFELVASQREEHRTPAGGIQPFTWVALRRS